MSGLVDHLFRHEAGRMVAALTRSFGAANLPLAEEVVQEALLQALRRWPFHGVPDRPVAWLYRVARNAATDRFRHLRLHEGKEDQIRLSFEHAAAASSAGRRPDSYLSGEITDDQLRLIFLCCHPALPAHGRVALTLKSVMGLSVGEIAGALRGKTTAVAQRITRAQRKIRAADFPFEVPPPDQLQERLGTVLEVLYLTFNEGYSTYESDELLRPDLCSEALRLAVGLTTAPAGDRPEVHALVSLMGFQASRLPARVDEDGELVRLEDQDRSKWDPEPLKIAFHHLGRAAQGSVETAYHLQAAIAAEHAAAADPDRTDWRTVVRYYDRLLRLQPSPIVGLNRAVALARLDGPRAGLAAVDALAEHPSIQDYYLLGATRGDLLERLGRFAEAAAAFRSALSCPCSGPERRFLERRRRAAEGAAGH